MAGTLGFTVAVRHTYQRRFNRQDLSKALAGCHWYIISARPAVRIIPGSARLDHGILTVGFHESSPGSPSMTASLYGTEYSDSDHGATFNIHDDGSYFSFEFPGTHLHGDSWSLAAFLSGGGPDMARHEILYIGKAYGDGSRTAEDRTASHEKLQVIYEDFHGQGMDIFVSPLHLVKSSWSSDDHIDDLEPGPSLTDYNRAFAANGGTASAAEVDLIEHSLISHFNPAYNVNLRKWEAPGQTKTMRLMRSTGFRLLNVHLDTSEGLARFCTATQPNAHRSHFVSHDVPPAPRKSVSRGISAMDLSQWRPGARLIREGPDMFSNLAEQRDLFFRTFGDEAPAARKPPTIFLDQASPVTEVQELASDLRETERQIRESINLRRQQEAAEKESLKYRGEPTYDPEAGTITIGFQESGDPVPWTLHDHNRNTQNGYLVSDDQTMNTSNLVVIKHQSELSGNFVTYFCDPTNRLNLTVRPITETSSQQRRANTPEATADAMLKVSDLVDHRASSPGDYQIGSGTAGLLLIVNNAETILGHPEISLAASNILTNGPDVGVGLVAAFGSVEAFTYAAWNWQGLGKVKNRLYGVDVPHSLPAWAAMIHAPKLPSLAVGDDLTFSVFHDEQHMYLGIVANVLDSSLNDDAAKDEFSDFIRNTFGGDLEWTVDDQEHGRYSGMLYQNVTRWFIRRIGRQWALLHVITNWPLSADAPQHESLGWADEVMRSRYRTPTYTWRLGPAPDGTQFAFYTTFTESIEVRDQSGKIMRLYQHLYE